MFNHSIVDECLTFLNDIPRNRWYREKIQQLVKGKIVFEIGCGAGILAAYCLEFGAKKYYGIDIRQKRSDYTHHLLESLGYDHNRFEILKGSFTDLSELPRFDILLCEQTSYQFQNNFTIKQFWNHVNQLGITDFISLPDHWAVDAYIYPTALDSNLPEYQPKLLLPDPELPRGFYEAVSRTDFVRPCQVVQNVVYVGPETASQPLEFVLDLSALPSATVVLQDRIGFGDDRCLSVSATTDWPGAIKIPIHQAGQKFKFYWDYNLTCFTGYNRGYWNYVGV